MSHKGLRTFIPGLALPLFRRFSSRARPWRKPKTDAGQQNEDTSVRLCAARPRNIIANVRGKQYETSSATLIAWDKPSSHDWKWLRFIYKTAAGEYFVQYQTWQDADGKLDQVDAIDKAEAARLFFEVSNRVVPFETAFPGLAAQTP